MSHIPERKEKDCLNCGTIIQGHYCQNCGQENVVTRETFWHMFTHFFYDITHFDSSFFHTIHHLILKPGFLSKEYMQGRRASYLHPIRMYVFTSAIFFLLFFTFFNPKSDFTVDPDEKLSTEQREMYIQTLQAQLRKDTGDVNLKQQLQIAKDTSKIIREKDKYKMYGEKGFIQFGGKNYRSKANYDSSERSLPPSERDGWFTRLMTKKLIEINEKYRHNPDEALKKFVEDVLHKLPYMLFVSLPLFAFILRLVYIRRRKEFYFADHGVFTIHLYVFTFLLLLLVFSLGTLSNATHWGFIDVLIPLVCIGLPVYLYLGLRNFYRQGWGKTFIKFLLVVILSLLMMLALFIFFIIFSVFTL